MTLPDDGLILVLKEDCPTCRLVAPVAAELARRGLLAAVYSQDDPAFPAGLDVVDDRSLAASFRLGTEIVPTLVRRRGGRETGRAVGWHRGEWQNLTGINGLGLDLPDERPGCGSLSVAPGMAEELQARFGETGLAAREVAVDFPEDPFEQMFDRGWTDGLPVVPPTPARVLRMLQGTARAPSEVLGEIPPSGAPCTIEKAAINAVMAGCRPDFFPVVLAAVEAALDPDFAWSGLMSTTMGAGVCVVVNGPVARRIGLNAGFNALGHGVRANSTIARALQLLVVNIGGAVPGGIDRSTMGHPGKRGLCFAEDERDPAWLPLAQARGVPAGRSAVTVFGFCGSTIHNDEKARNAEGLTRTLAGRLEGSAAMGLVGDGAGGMLVLGGEFSRIYREAGWDRARTEAALAAASPAFAGGDILLVRAGSEAGLFATMLQGWASGPRGSQPVTREVTP